MPMAPDSVLAGGLRVRPPLGVWGGADSSPHWGGSRTTAFSDSEVEGSRRVVLWLRTRLLAEATTRFVLITVAAGAIGLRTHGPLDYRAGAVAAAVVLVASWLGSVISRGAVWISAAFGPRPYASQLSRVARLTDAVVLAAALLVSSSALRFLMLRPVSQALLVAVGLAVGWGLFQLAGPFLSRPVGDPLSGPLTKDVQAVAERMGRQLKGLRAVAPHPLLPSSGGGYLSRSRSGTEIVLDQNLLGEDPRAARAVAIHELGHLVLGHPTIAAGVAGLQVGFSLLAGVAAAEVGRYLRVPPGGSSQLILCWTAVLLGLSAGASVRDLFSRRAERAADLFALSAAVTPEDAAGALRRCARDELAVISAPRLLRWRLSHPPLAERLTTVEGIRA